MLASVYKPHVRFDEEFEVHANTFGVPLHYSLQTVNISKSGILTGSKRKLPFCVNTLVELRIDPNGKKLENVVTCVGKIVRFASEDIKEAKDYSIFLGIEINEPLDEHFKEWEKYCLSLEAANGNSFSIYGK
jgi:hypothetical protein